MDFKKGLSSSTLHILAMFFMLLDHAWATIFISHTWMTCVGRIAFPIFAFMIVEGLYYTHDKRKYLLRLLIAAIISEIPFNLMVSTSFIYPYHQNVIWTFLISALLILMIEAAKKKEKLWLTILVSACAVILAVLVGTLTMVDYYAGGVLTVLVFYFFRGRKWWCYLGQLLCLYYINVELIGGYYFNVNLFGHDFEVVQQGLALIALLFIWLYKGNQGYHKKWFQYFCYGFYPVHMLILYLIYLCI